MRVAARVAGFFVLSLIVMVACSLPPPPTQTGASAISAGAPLAPAPAFSSSDLTRAPTQDWLTYGGDIYGQRFANVSQITPGNVSNLRGVWRIHLNSAVGEKYSAEGTPIVYDGVI